MIARAMQTFAVRITPVSFGGRMRWGWIVAFGHTQLTFGSGTELDVRTCVFKAVAEIRKITQLDFELHVEADGLKWTERFAWTDADPDAGDGTRRAT